MASEKDQRAVALEQALGHPLRRRILWLIKRQTEAVLSPTEAAAQLERPLSNVSYHFRVLGKAQAIELNSTRRVDGSVQRFYLVAPEAAALDWVQAILDSGSAPA